MTIKIIGIDPGLADTGIGIITGHNFTIEDYSFGSISTSKELSLPIRLEIIYSKVLSVLEKETPQLIVVEDIFSLKRYPKSGILLGKVTGVILLAASHTKIPVIEIPVREAKKVLSGNGNATKSQLEKTVRHLLNHNGKISPDHASDALALAIIGLYRFDNLIK